MTRLLLFTTFWWPSTALLAVRLADAGFEVRMLCPRGHSAFEEPGIDCVALPGRAVASALRAAIEAAGPALVIPMDDRAVRHLHGLHAAAGVEIRTLIERSLGAPAGFGAVRSRAMFTRAAASAGLATPRESGIHGPRDLDDCLRDYGLPLVLKVDGLTGGQGVAIVTSRRDAGRAYARLRLKLTGAFAIKRWLVNRDPFWLSDRGASGGAGLTVQEFVAGRGGDLAFFCLDGELLGASVAETVSRAGDAGPSTFVRFVERPDLVLRAAGIASALGLSGFYGLDFIVDGEGREVAIELNPRITALAAIRSDVAGSPIAAAAKALLGSARTPFDAPPRAVHAHFPLAWRCCPDDPRLSSCADDVPWDHPRLIDAMLHTPWSERGLLARFWSRIAGRRGGKSDDGAARAALAASRARVEGIGSVEGVDRSGEPLSDA